MNIDIKPRVYKVISNVLTVPIGQINDQSSPDTIEVWDSLQHMSLILALEEEFGVQFTDLQTVEMQSVGLIIAVLSEILLRAQVTQ